MLTELLKNGFGKKERYSKEDAILYNDTNLNCAERILHGANRAYGLGLTKEQLNVSAAFGGGMGIGSVCGAVTGALMVLSLRYCSGTEKQCPLKDEITAPFLRRVRAKMGGLTCHYLKPHYTACSPFNCDALVLEIAEILDATVAEWDRARA